MCGIAGILGEPSLIGPEEEEIVEEMKSILIHRGPDDEGTYKSKFGIFGHRRLSIIDLDNGRQPMVSADKRYVLIFNGEIYNYIELRQKLLRQRASFQTFSDTEVLLQMLIYHGENAIYQLNGMFAFAFLDTHTGNWILARDQFGIKPLYYTCSVQDRLIFASEIKALFKHPKVKPQVDYISLNHYLTFQFCLNSHTLFKGIEKLEPGYYIKGRFGKVLSRVQYWDPDFIVNEENNEEYFLNHLRYLLEDSSRLQLRSDVELGAYLSGGTDSSTIASLAYLSLNNGMPLFTGKFLESPDYDESHYARIVANKGNSPLHEVVPKEKNFVEYLPNIIRALDEPVAGPGAFPQFMVSAKAAEHVKVVLAGTGGDEIFGGYARYLVGYLEQALKGAIFRTNEEGKHLVNLENIIPNLPLLKNYSPLMKSFWKDGLFEDMDKRYFRLIDRSPQIDFLLTPDMKSQYDKSNVFEEFRSIFNHPNTLSYINKMTHFDFKTLLPALLQVEDRVSMAVSLESRVPFLDTRIMELVASVPPAMKFRGGETKALLKRAVKHIVAKEILERKDKMGFPVPLKEWMQKGPVKEFVSDILLSKNSKQRGIFKPESLEKMLISQGVGGRQLWGALSLEIWHREFIDI